MATAAKNLSDWDLSGLPSGEGLRVALVTADWNQEITEALYEGAHRTLLQAGLKAKNILRRRVPGSIELTFAAKELCQSDLYDAVIAIGVVIEGETRHFDYVCQSVTQGITELNLRYSTPVIFCVLTDRNIEQSRARSGGKHGNKGVEAAVAALRMALRV